MLGRSLGGHGGQRTAKSLTWKRTTSSQCRPVISTAVAGKQQNPAPATPLLNEWMAALSTLEADTELHKVFEGLLVSKPQALLYQPGPVVGVIQLLLVATKRQRLFSSGWFWPDEMLLELSTEMPPAALLSALNGLQQVAVQHLDGMVEVGDLLAASAPGFGFQLLRVPPAELVAKIAVLREAIPEFTPASVLMACPELLFTWSVPDIQAGIQRAGDVVALCEPRHTGHTTGTPTGPDTGAQDSSSSSSDPPCSSRSGSETISDRAAACQVALQLIRPDHPLASITPQGHTNSHTSSASSSQPGSGSAVGSSGPSLQGSSGGQSSDQGSNHNSPQAPRPPPRRRPGRGGPMGLTPDLLFSDSAAQLSLPGSKVLLMRVPSAPGMHSPSLSEHGVVPPGGSQQQPEAQAVHSSTGGDGSGSSGSTSTHHCIPAGAHVIANMVNVRRLLYIRAGAGSSADPAPGRGEQYYEVRLDDPYRQEEALVASGYVTGPHARGLPPRALSSSRGLSSLGSSSSSSNPTTTTFGQFSNSTTVGQSNRSASLGPAITTVDGGTQGPRASTGAGLPDTSPVAQSAYGTTTSDWSRRVTLGSVDAWPRPQQAAVTQSERPQGLNNVVPGFGSTGSCTTVPGSITEGEEAEGQGELLDAWLAPQRHLHQGYTPSTRLVWPHHARRQHAPSSSAFQ